MKKLGVAVANLVKAGGMERYASDIVSGFLDAGAEVEVLVRKSEPESELGKRLGSRLAQVWMGWLPGKLRDSYFSRRVDAWRRRRSVGILIGCCRIRHPDVVICGGTHHGFLGEMGKRPGWTDRLKLRMEEDGYAHAAVIVAHSRLVAGELERLCGVDPAKIRLLYPPVDYRRFRPVGPEDKAKLREEFGFSASKKIFLFPSGSHERKGLPLIRTFFEETDLPVELLVLGRKVTPGRNVRSVGYSATIERMYQAADATILASRYEPFGLVGIESVLCGTPVVLPADMGCCEVLVKPALFAFAPGNLADMGRAVREAVAFGSGEGEGGPLAKHIRYDYTIENHVKALMALFDSDICG